MTHGRYVLTLRCRTLEIMDETEAELLVLAPHAGAYGADLVIAGNKTVVFA